MSENLKPFVGPKLKVQRALHHIEDLKRQSLDFAATNPYNFYFDVYSNRSPTILFGMIAYIPPSISLLIGDAVHGLRSALDLLAGDLARMNNRSANGVYFPIADQKANLNRAIDSKNFKKTGDAAVRHLKSLKPWRDGNPLLRALHDLNNQDKHQLILPTRPALFLPELKLIFSNGGPIELSNAGLGPDTKIGIPRLPDFVQIKGELKLDLSFGPGVPQVLQRRSYIAALNDIAVMTQGIIESFEKLTLGSVGDQPALNPIRHDPRVSLRPQAIVRRNGENVNLIPISRT